ncbi:transaldolase [Streptosporangium lutulentum]|uniref:Transaldolase n=1 Tax=Streptosporangium lutulentum TaxID=1461250 RepID=A0ABT9QD29_9ACTN|nr:transaldolase [Streptosporangium lutulentum]MDP9844673.1 transaldolase [Streptosporangium lutulentum]
MTEILKRLSEQGVSIWLDDISRERLRTGNLEALIREKSIVGVTSNPTIFASALSKGDAYDTQLHDLKVRGVDLEESVRAITTYDIRWAADVLKPVYDATRGVDGRVSIEVDPRLARETDKTIAEARALWWMVDRPNLFIKIPATVEGLPAIAQAISEGISVNVTLIFSLERYRAVMEAWLTGLERAKANGLDLSGIESVASFFVSRVDGEIDKRLDKIGTPEALALRGKAAVANARLAFAAFEDVMNSARWQALAAAGARPQRPLWASTGTKNPEYPDTLYVDELVAPGTVNTMPEKTLNAVADHGRISGDTVRPFYEQAWNTMAALKEIGIDYDDVVRFLEEDGVAKFETSWTELLSTIAAELKKA